MTRRQTLLHFAAILLATTTAAPHAQAQEALMPFEDWVRDFYETQLRDRAAKEAAPPDATAEPAPATPDLFRAALSPDTGKLYDATRGAQLPAGELDGPILHIVFGWGALPNRPIKLISVEKRPWWRSLGPSALVTLDIAGNTRELIVKGMFNELTCLWRIDDIDYGSGGPDETLRGRLERVASWEKQG
nr:hypothetical protein [uncultured Dongia sp.]